MKKKPASSDNSLLLTVAALFAAVLLVFGLPRWAKDLTPYYYASQIVAAIFIVVAGLVALWQYRITNKNNHTSIADIRVQRAIDLSAFYKDSILRYYPAIYYVFDRCGLNAIMDTVPLSKMVSFDSEELNRLLSREQMDSFKKTTSSKEFIAAMIEADEIYHIGLDIKKEISDSEKEDGNVKMRITVNTERVITAFLTSIKDQILNNLEYFAMAFTHNTADESVVYQSLHQSYFEVVHTLYYFIANSNTSSTDKYYTNVIKLHKTWRKRCLEQEKQRKALSNVNIHNGTIVD